MPAIVTINRPDVVMQIEALAHQLTGGDTTEVVSLALKALEQCYGRAGSLFGVMRGSVTVRDGVDLTEPVLQDVMEAEVGRAF